MSESLMAKELQLIYGLTPKVPIVDGQQVIRAATATGLQRINIAQVLTLTPADFGLLSQSTLPAFDAAGLDPSQLFDSLITRPNILIEEIAINPVHESMAGLWKMDQAIVSVDLLPGLQDPSEGLIRLNQPMALPEQYRPAMVRAIRRGSFELAA